jgi:uncharacterized protein
MSNRREFIAFLIGSSSIPILNQVLGNSIVNAATKRNLTFTPIRLPHPLPIYQTSRSYLPTDIGKGKIVKPSSNTQLSTYQVIDDVVVPPEYDRYIILRWGDKVFADPEEYIGYNCDYTAFIPTDKDSKTGYLWINHEYISFPFSNLAPDTPSELAGFASTFATVIDKKLPDTQNRELLGEFLYNLGGSVVKISRQNDRGRFIPVKDAKNRRLHGLSGLGINADRTDDYKQVTSWGESKYQKGDRNYLIGTGVAATEVFNLSSDGLDNKIIGTAYNCSGATTPWGTILSGEENFQGSTKMFVGVTEAVKPNGTQLDYIPKTTGAEFGLVGEKYGWMVEVDPADLDFRPRKHTAMGRYRHENATLRIKAGKPLIAYLGDDRRGGHTWKYVSKGKVKDPKDKANSDLFAEGTLYVAQYNPNGTGKWIPLKLSTPTNPIPPTQLSSVEFKALKTAQKDGRLPLPKRQGIAQQKEDGGSFDLDRTNETTVLPEYKGKKLSDFYSSQGAILCDAFLAANLVGGTPTARPEDLEVHPTTKEVLISYTDGAPGDGYPDSRIFVVAKYSKTAKANQQSGGLYKIIEDSKDGTGLTFRWQRFAQGGEAGTENGSGFGNIDNLAIDPQGNIWGVTDMPTGTHNGFEVGAAGKETEIDRNKTGNVSALAGVFGNNWLFYMPIQGKYAGEVIPFAYGPMRCEMTGPTFVGDTLILSIQHPGEECPINDGTLLNRTIEILDLDGSVFEQKRTIPRGSSWPDNISSIDGGEAEAQGLPRPAVIGIHRKKSEGQFL